MAALARAEILRPEPPPGFVHPLVRDAVYHGLPLGERELLHARAAACWRTAPRSTRSPASSCTRRAAATPRSRALLHEAGDAALARGAVDSAVGYLRRALEEPPPAERAPAAAARPRRGRGAHARARRPPSTCARPTTGSPTSHLRVRGRERARPRAAVHHLARRGRARSPARRRASLPPELADEALGAGGVRADGRPVRRARPGGDASSPSEYRHRPLRTPGEKMHGARRRARVDPDAAATSTRSSRSRARRWSGGELLERDPNLLTLAALLPMIVGDREEALQIFDLAMADAHRRGSLFAVTGMHLWRGFTLFWRGDLVDAEEQLTLAFDQAEAWGYGPDTLQWNAAHLRGA